MFLDTYVLVVNNTFMHKNGREDKRSFVGTYFKAKISLYYHQELSMLEMHF